MTTQNVVKVPLTFSRDEILATIKRNLPKGSVMKGREEEILRSFTNELNQLEHDFLEKNIRDMIDAGVMNDAVARRAPKHAA